uniref:DUF7894 domain-containing protein n=1 Tax=Musa acuminata subsp. malaccensis TaxID=214687 RepID=A0A804IAL4_MUSAM|nr:PREDICTED: uncharacterized protein LOC103977865 [Musa acuminata subsp. malaccensis]
MAPTVIVLVRDADGFGPTIAEALLPIPNSNLTREISSFELSLEKYDVKDSKASGDLIQFLDPSGSPQVSIFILQNYEPPLAACVTNELLASFSNETTIVLPFVMKALKINREEMSGHSVDQEVTLYAAKIGGISELTKAMISGAISAPPSLQIHCELLACLLLMARILSLPTVLIAAGGQRSNRKSSNPELEALYELGQLVASNLGLCFSKDKIQQKHPTKSTSVQEPWRALYG